MITGLQLRLSYQFLERTFQPNCRIVQELGIVTGSSLQGMLDNQPFMEITFKYMHVLLISILNSRLKLLNTDEINIQEQKLKSK